MSDALPILRDEAGPFAGVATITLTQPGKPVVVLDRALIEALEAALDRVPSGTLGVVIASASTRVFVAGADLRSISALSDAELHDYLAYGSRVFGKIASLPCPTVAAINGAALGGGLELAMHCDGLVGAPGIKPYPIGLPEAGLGLCPGWGGTNLLPARIDPAFAIRQTAEGKPMMFDEAVQARLFDAVAPSAERLLETAKEWLLKARERGTPARNHGTPSRWIGTRHTSDTRAAVSSVRGGLPGTEAAAAVLSAVEAGLTSGWKRALDVEQQELVRLRHTPPARMALDAFFAKSAAKA
jgi:enoyl-CoA hydratase/carnithine racemase